LATKRLKDGDGKEVTDDKALADLLNQSFKSIFTREDMRNVPVPEDMHPTTVLLAADFLKERHAEKNKKTMGRSMQQLDSRDWAKGPAVNRGWSCTGPCHME
jgi:hypothetical protein